MGASQSASELVPSSSSDEEEEEDDDADERLNSDRQIIRQSDPLKKVLQQEPEMLPCHASASPLSAFGTPRSLGPPSIKVWDPYNVLSPPPPPPPSDHHLTLVYFISHADSHVNLRPDLISGRCPEAALTPTGKRQARALAVFFTSQAVRFNAVYSSPLDRARATALYVCQYTVLLCSAHHFICGSTLQSDDLM